MLQDLCYALRQIRKAPILVMADVFWLAGISIVVTLPLAFLLSHVLRTRLYNVGAAGPRKTEMLGNKVPNKTVSTVGQVFANC